MHTFNMDIKNEILKSGARFYEVANQLGIADTTFSKRLRKELPLAEKAKIRDVLMQLSKERGLND